MTEHTPGPWKVGRYQSSQGYFIDAPGAKDYFIADVHENDKRDAAANARLIASAPALLALAERIAAWDDVNGVPELSGAIDQARAAIAAARGEK